MTVLEDAARWMAEAIGNGYTSYDVAFRFSCGEADSIAAVMVAVGDIDAATTWLTGHAEDDDHGDRHFTGDHPDVPTVDIAEYVANLAARMNEEIGG